MEIKITGGNDVCDSTFKVECDEMVADKLGYDEMLGLVSVFSLASLEDTPCLGYLKKKKKVYRPKDGEFVAWHNGSVISIYHCLDKDKKGCFKAYASLYTDNLYLSVSDRVPEDFRPVTDDEKSRLLLALARKDKFWNAGLRIMYTIDVKNGYNVTPL